MSIRSKKKKKEGAHLRTERAKGFPVGMNEHFLHQLLNRRARLLHLTRDEAPPTAHAIVVGLSRAHELVLGQFEIVSVQLHYYCV